MEDTSNGSLKGGKSSNGSLKPSLNGHAIGTQRRRAKAGSSLFAQALNIVGRLLTWYSIFSILFRCPETLQACDESSPRICRPYFRLKEVVSPHVEPYYNTYAAPYVEVVRPYYQTLDENVVSPAWAYASKHGKPLLEQGQVYGQAQWGENVQPLLAKYQALAQAQYEETLAPHVDHVTTTVGPYYDIARTNALQTYHELLLPTYEYVRPYAQQGYLAASAFATDVAAPSAIWAWNKAYLFLDGTVGPQLRVIYAENVEPQLVRIGQRLGRYSERKPAQKLNAESMARSVPTAKTARSSLTESSSASKVLTSSSFAKPTRSVSASASSSSPSAPPPESSAIEPEAVQETPQVGEASPSETQRVRAEPVPPPEFNPNDNEDDVRRTAREIVAEDLKSWQERYAKAADEGAAEIEERVEEITKRMIQRDAKTTGRALLEELQSTVVSELITLRRHILNIVGAVVKGSATLEDGQEQVVTVVRQAGLAIREKAQEVRTWRENFEKDVQTAITDAAREHFMILDGIKDLALQKIGMKWAWMEGITYKDWAKYHLLKDRFEEWSEELKQLIVTHPGLVAAQNAGADVEDEAMKVASSAAKELARLKQVALWKLAAADDSAEFDSDLTRQAAEAAESAKLASSSASASEESSIPSSLEAEPNSDPSIRSTIPVAEESTTSDALSAGDLVPEMPLDAEQAPSSSSSEAADESTATPESLSTSTTSLDVSSSEESTSSVPIQDVESSVVEAPLVSTSTASEEGFEATPDLASTSILGDPMMENIVEVEDDKHTPVNVSPEPKLEEPLVELPLEDPPVQSPLSASVKPALFGAAAQSVPDRKPILEDQLDELPSSLASFAQSAYSAALSRADAQYSQAVSVVSAQIHGTPEPVHEQMLASVTSAYSNALASASSRFGEVLSSAHDQIYGTPAKTNKLIPTPVPIPSLPDVDWARIESIAGERLQQGRAWAEEQYESAKIAVGLATPTPSTPSEHISKALENARHNYYAGLGIAHARYSEFLEAAAAAINSLTATPTPTDAAGSLSSAASVVSESAASIASVAGENLASAADKAAENWEVLVTKISIQVYGAATPTPWYQSAYSAAGEYVSSAGQAAADSASSVTSAAGSFASGAHQDIDNQYQSVSSIVSELLIGKEPTFAESIYSRLQAAYSAGVQTAEHIASDAAQAAKTAGGKVASAASDAAEAAKETAAHLKDEL